MRPLLAIDAIINEAAPSYLGVKFDSKPAALRQLLMVKEITENVVCDGETVGLDVGSKYPILGTLLRAFGLRTIRLDLEKRGDPDDFVLANGERMPFMESSLDFVVLSHVLTHVDNVNNLLHEVGRVLKPRGILFILQSNRFGWWRFWARYLRRNDHLVHRRAFDVWSMRNTLAAHNLEIVKMYCPYYFYLHSKLSDLFYRLDRRLASRVPALFATQWIILARPVPESEGRVGLTRTPGWPFQGLVATLAVVQSLAVKSLELGLRVWYRPGWGGGEAT